jgi:integrase
MLTELALKAAKPKEKIYKLADGRGLYIEINPTGSMYWRMKYRYAGKEKRISLGVYPEVSLKNARIALLKAREQLANGVDPSELRKVRKAAQISSATNSFQAVGEEWFSKQKPIWAEKHWTKVQWMLEKNLYPWLGQRPISEITAPELLAVLRRIESRGAIETAKRTKQVAGQVFRFAVATGRTERDPSQDLKDALAASVKKHLAAITEPKAVGPFLCALDAYQGTPIIRAALQMAPLTFVRPGELRNAQWSEINFDTAEWRIPAERMKARQPHIVPLSRQALEVLQELHLITGRGVYLFPSPRSPRRPMSDNAVLSAMRRMGVGKEEMCGHGFRAMARTILDEILNYRVDWIEHQLAHAVKDANGRAYNRTSHLEGRRKMMQGWADYLDTLRMQANGSNVVPIQQHVEAK